MEEIERENLKIALNIYKTKATLPAMKMIQDFNRHRKISNGLRRIKKKKIPAYEGRAGALPPIYHATEGDDTYDSANSERRSPNTKRSRDPSLEEANR